MNLDDVTPGPWEAKSHEVTMNDRSEWRIGPPNKPQVLRSVMSRADAQFIAEARERVPHLENVVKHYKQDVLNITELWIEAYERIEEALYMHRNHDCYLDPCVNSSSPYIECEVSGSCQECQKPYPCPTRTILTGEDE